MNSSIVFKKLLLIISHQPEYKNEFQKNTELGWCYSGQKDHWSHDLKKSGNRLGREIREHDYTGVSQATNSQAFPPLLELSSSEYINFLPAILYSSSYSLLSQACSILDLIY